MNAPHKDIDKIRSLVDCYYNGIISPEDFKVLVDYFKLFDREDLPIDMREDAELILLTAYMGEAFVAMPSNGLEKKIRAATVDKIECQKHRMYIYLAKPVAAAAVIALVFMAVLLKPVMPSDVVTDKLPTISVRFAIQADDESMIQPTIMAEDASLTLTPVKEKSTPVFAQVYEEEIEETDNYIEITNVDQASMLAQDALALLRRKLAVAGYSIGSASVGLRHIDETMRDIIVN